eukprot:CAMPEP_0175353912 /NCGR_PEP_ID=MMETSP0095-20121207/12683_1 /TAXON_ID=311494 /ORGANISM="Alexandrium monilatum, Strain CCMP3105" /LENGTH=141 /DNA_ID=CAMNT_0016651537 /DNA_START=51 /DNA_END=475 /DNA_ORIENTATION=+
MAFIGQCTCERAATQAEDAALEEGKHLAWNKGNGSCIDGPESTSPTDLTDFAHQASAIRAHFAPEGLTYAPSLQALSRFDRPEGIGMSSEEADDEDPLQPPGSEQELVHEEEPHEPVQEGRRHAARGVRDLLQGHGHLLRP